MSASFGKISVFSGSNKVSISVRSGLAANYNLALPNTAPTDNQILRWDNTAGALVWSSATNTSIVSARTYLTAVDSGGGNYTLDFASQTAGLFLASPSGGAGVPSFRAIVNADIASFDASKLTGTIAAARMPNGTDASSWQIGTSSLNPKIVAASTTTLEVRQNDNSLGHLVVGSFTATGTVNFTNVNTVEVGDNILRLNNDLTAGTTPTEDAGIEVNRGNQTAFFFGFQESTDRLVAGITGTLYQVGLKLTRNIVSTDVVTNVVTWTHNLNTTNLIFQLRDASGVSIGVDSTTANANSITIDMTGLTVTGTWTGTIFA